MNFGFTYAGIVANNKDPLKLGRLKVRVPHVFGSDSSGSGSIPVNDLPWALPAGLPAGGSGASGGFSQLPDPGDKVWVRFLDGEPEKPIWEWGMQSTDDRDNLQLHTYASGTPVGPPDRTVWTRYSNAIEINEGSIIATTSQGYRIILTDATDVGTSDGNLTITTQLGNMIQLDDLDSTIKITALEDLYFIVFNGVIGSSDNFAWQTSTGFFSINSGGTFDVTTVDGINLTTSADTFVDSLGNTTLTTTGDFLLGFATLQLGLAATEPAVLGAMLSEFLTTLLTLIDTHTHLSAAPSEPTSPPVAPLSLVLTPQMPALLSATVLIQN